VLPSNALDAYGLMIAAIRDPNPVMVLLPKALIRVKDTRLLPGEPADSEELSRMIDAPIADRTNWKPQWPEIGEHVVKIGTAELVREGVDGTVISYGRPLPLCVQAADELARDRGHTFDVIDLRSIFPLRLAPDLAERRQDQPRTDRQRGHRGDEFRRTPAAPDRG